MTTDPTTSPQAGPGRPTTLLKGYKRTDGTWEPASPAGRLIAALAAGNWLVAAADVAHVSRSTVMAWLARGQRALETDGATGDYQADRRKLPAGERVYADLAMAVRGAEAECEVEMISGYREAAKTDARLVMPYLERRHGDRWRRPLERQQVDVRGHPLASDDWIETRSVILDAIAPYPQAKAAMIAALASLTQPDPEEPS